VFEASDPDRRVFIDLFCSNHWVELSLQVEKSLAIIQECSSFVMICSSTTTTADNCGTISGGTDDQSVSVASVRVGTEAGEIDAISPNRTSSVANLTDKNDLAAAVELSESPTFTLNRLWCLTELLVACLRGDDIALIVKCGELAFHKKNNHPYLRHDSAAVLEISDKIDISAAHCSSDLVASALWNYITSNISLSPIEANAKLRRGVTASLACIDSSTVQAAACGDEMSGFQVVTNAYDVLVAATISGYLKVIQMIVNDGYDLKQAKTHHSQDHALIEAANNDRVLCLELLLTGGFPVDCPNRAGGTALAAAAIASHKRCVDLLLAHGADLNHRDAEGLSVLMVVVLHNQFEFMEYLILKGADPLEVSESGVSVLMCAMSGAVMRGDLRCVQYLVDKCNCKAHINSRDNMGDCCVLIAACTIDCLKYVVSVGGEINVSEDGAGGGRTPLMKACEQGEVECVQFLIDCGADVTCVDSVGRACVTIAKRSKSARKNKCVQLISEAIKNGTDKKKTPTV
jgi:uncharacterized protein